MSIDIVETIVVLCGGEIGHHWDIGISRNESLIGNDQ